MDRTEPNRSITTARTIWPFMPLGAICLLSPFLVVIGMWNFTPSILETLYVNYTGWDHSYIQQSVERGEPLSPEMLGFVRDLYLERTAIETMARTYNFLTPALTLAGSTGMLALVIHAFYRRKVRLSLLTSFAGTAAFLFLAFLASILVGIDRSFTFASMATVIFFLNFPLASALASVGRKPRTRWLGCVILLATSYASHLLAPVALFVIAARCFWQDSSKANHLAVHAGRATACAVSFPLVTFLFFSLQTNEISSSARPLLKAKNLYDVEIDHPANQVLVTTKDHGQAYAVPLDLISPIRSFRVPTAELEDIALDTDRREIYHVDRSTGEILVLDADTFAIRRKGQIPIPSSGSTKLALVKSANRIFISWENDHFMAINLKTLQVEAYAILGNVNPLGDERDGVVFVNYSKAPFVDAIDARTLKLIHRAPGSERGERMAFSAKRRELYSPDALRSRVWAYSTPQLEVIRKIPTQFGVRALAVDDKHGLLLAASLITGYVDVIDLASNETIQHHYVGKYGRIIGIDSLHRRAFITITNEGLFLLEY